MIVHNVFALIEGDEIKNMFICDDYTQANLVSKAAFGDSAFAVEATQYNVAIGDHYRDGYFYRAGDDERPVAPEPLPEDELRRVAAELSAAQEQNTVLELALTEMYEGMVS